MYIILDEKNRNYNKDEKGTINKAEVKPGFRTPKQPKVKGRKKQKALQNETK